MFPNLSRAKYTGALLFGLCVCGTLPRVLSAQIAVLGSTVEETVASPGEKYSGTIVVKNLTSTAQPVRIYQSDYTFFADGTSHFDSAGSVRRSNASWVRPAVSSMIIPAASEMSVAYTVRVPALDTLRGTYWSTIMVEAAPSNPRAGQGRQVGLGSIMRYSIQVAVHIARPASTKVSFDKQTVATASDGSRALAVEVSNVGERGYRPKMWIEIYDARGTLAARVEQQRGLLYPGTSLLQKFALGRLPSGTYKAVVFADAGEDTLFAAQYKLTF